jgi:O-antigen/teichoic acid export membrane protein
VTQPSGKLRDLLRTGAGIAVAMAVMNVSTYAFTILAARRLGPAEYGAFGSLMGLLLVVNVLSLGLQATGARRVAAAPGDRDRIEAEVLAATYRSATWLTVACLAAAPLAARVLELDGWWAALTIGAAAFPLTLMGGYAGILQGEQRWLPLAGVYLGMGVGRLAVGAAALLVVPTALVPAVAGALALHRPARARERALAPRGRAVLGEVAGNSHALLAFFALSNTDVVVARIVLPPEDAGLYTAGLILTKAVLFLPQFVVVIAFPSMSQDTQRHRMYLRGLAVVAVIGAAATAGTALLSELAVFFVGGDQYAEVEPLLWLFAALGTAYAMVQLMVYEVVARQHRASVYVVWAGLVVVVASAPALGSVGSLAATVAAVNGGVLLLLLVTALLRRDHAADIASRRALVAPQDDHRSAGQTN